MLGELRKDLRCTLLAWDESQRRGSTQCTIEVRAASFLRFVILDFLEKNPKPL